MLLLELLLHPKINHRLTLFYLANDVVQNGKRKGFLQFGNSFAEVLREATLLVRRRMYSCHLICHLLQKIHLPFFRRRLFLLTSLNDTPGKVHSPPTKNFCPKFIREDLAVSLNDLENIFDTSSSEEDNDECNPMLSNMNGMNGPLIVGACGGGIPVAMVPMVSVGAMNGTDQGNQNSLSSMGNGSGDLKYDEKKRINQGQNKNINRKLPSNGAQQMIKLNEKQTSPPDYLTEAELIKLMEKRGIGTNASIPVHINNICQRNYVTVASGWKLVPTNLGIVLVHGYQKVETTTTIGEKINEMFAAIPRCGCYAEF